jgi:hypothetical protein
MHEMRSPKADMARETYEKIAAYFEEVREVDLTEEGTN